MSVVVRPRLVVDARRSQAGRMQVGTADYGLTLVHDADGRCKVCGERSDLRHAEDCPYEDDAD